MNINSQLKNIITSQKVDEGFHQLFFTDENGNFPNLGSFVTRAEASHVYMYRDALC